MCDREEKIEQKTPILHNSALGQKYSFTAAALYSLVHRVSWCSWFRENHNIYSWWLTKSLVCVFSNNHILEKKAEKEKNCETDDKKAHQVGRKSWVFLFLSTIFWTEEGCRKCIVSLILFSTTLISPIHCLTHTHTRGTIIFPLTHIPSWKRLGNY